jgi:hypothetical protein
MIWLQNPLLYHHFHSEVYLKNQILLLEIDGLVCGAQRHFQQYFSFIVAVIRRKPPTCR